MTAGKEAGRMQDNHEKITWREALALNKRALVLWLREYPKLFAVTGFHALAAALVPYLTLYFSARLLDELAGERRAELLTKWVVILLAADAAAYLLKALLFRWKQALSANLYYWGEARLSQKLLLSLKNSSRCRRYAGCTSGWTPDN